MPRLPRKKGLSNIHHIMNRSISEIQLFRDSCDKYKFLNIIKKYQKFYMFNIYSYVLMDTHYHLQIYSNGSDISKFMKSINQSYAHYYNKKYNRHGHVFADRFKSKPIENDSYAIAVSSYIHNNPKDIKGFENCVENYKFSSLHIYMGKHSNYSDIIDTSFILRYFNQKNYKARKSYLSFVSKNPNLNLSDDIEFENIKSYYPKEKYLLVRNFNPEEITSFILKYTNSKFCIHGKYNHKSLELKSISIVLLRYLCDFSLEKISKIVGNVTCSNIWSLCEKGISLINTDDKYRNIIKDFIKYNKPA